MAPIARSRRNAAEFDLPPKGNVGLAAECGGIGLPPKGNVGLPLDLAPGACLAGRCSRTQQIYESCTPEQGLRDELHVVLGCFGKVRLALRCRPDLVEMVFHVCRHFCRCGGGCILFCHFNRLVQKYSFPTILRT